MKRYVIIVAGGAGTRMGGDLPKQFQLLKGKSLLWHSIHAFRKAYSDINIVIVLPANYLNEGQSLQKEFSPANIRITTGGGTRFHSVQNGLNAVNEQSIVFIHDAVRCLVSPQLIRACYSTALEKGNAIPAIAATDTIRIETSDGNHPVDRSKVRIIQTPQTFYSDDLKMAFMQEYDPSFTDEASVLERSGAKINLVEGEASNIKITAPIDLLLAEKILEAQGSL